MPPSYARSISSHRSKSAGRINGPSLSTSQSTRSLDSNYLPSSVSLPIICATSPRPIWEVEGMRIVDAALAGVKNYLLQC